MLVDAKNRKAIVNYLFLKDPVNFLSHSHNEQVITLSGPI